MVSRALILAIFLVGTTGLLPAITPWPHGRVVFWFDASVDLVSRQAVLAAAQAWDASPVLGASSVDLQFQEVPYSWERALLWDLGLDTSLRIQVDRTLSSFGSATLGAGFHRHLVFDPSQSYSSWIVADLVHEWGHVLGLTHEHQRRDRDQYVVFPPGFLESLPADRRADYTILPNDPPSNEPRPYDYLSVMQYSSNIDGNRMRRRDTGALIKQNRVPSEGDRARIKMMYLKQEGR